MPDEILEDLIAVTREGLTNVARHAGASTVAVDLGSSGGQLVLELAYDGIGIGTAERRSGLANLRQRAENQGGTLLLGVPPGTDDEKGTILRWTIPLN